MDLIDLDLQQMLAQRDAYTIVSFDAANEAVKAGKGVSIPVSERVFLSYGEALDFAFPRVNTESRRWNPGRRRAPHIWPPPKVRAAVPNLKREIQRPDLVVLHLFLPHMWLYDTEPVQRGEYKLRVSGCEGNLITQELVRLDGRLGQPAELEARNMVLFTVP